MELITDLRGSLEHLTKANHGLVAERDKLITMLRQKDAAEKMRNDFFRAEKS